MNHNEQPIAMTPTPSTVPLDTVSPFTEPAVSAIPEQAIESPIEPPVLEKCWFYESGGQRIGAVSTQDMIKLIRAGTLTHGAVVWKKGFPDWLVIEDTELRSYLDDLTPPPLTGMHVNNTVVWILAFAPVIGFFMQYFVAAFLTGSAEVYDAVDAGSYWYVSLIINIALSYWDEKRLEKAGISTERMSGWVWLVPVYLYQRTRALKHNLAYFIVWCVCFALTLI